MGCEQSKSDVLLLNRFMKNGKKFSSSNSSSGISDLNFEDPELQEAAKKIQKSYRGHRERNLKMAQEEEVVDIDLEDPDVALAAARIQASFRGHQAKRAAEKAEKTEADLSKKMEELKTTSSGDDEELPDLGDPELNKAATKIQAQFRGHMVRKTDEKTKETK